MASVWLCRCGCHSAIKADHESAKQLGQWQTALIASSDPLINAIIPVDASDPLEAAAACPACLANHVTALSDVPPPFLPPTDWTPQADGEGTE